MSIQNRTQSRLHATRAERERIERLARHSVDLILREQAASGAYPASPSFSVYRYSWFRDGAFIADAMSRLGHRESAERFFRWCSDVLTGRAARIDSLLERRAAGEPIPTDGYLPCRYTLEGEDAREEWWEFQLDGYGTWLWALDQHRVRHGASIEPYAEAVERCVRYLAAFWDEPCYDWWEEHPQQRHTSTLAALYGGLAAASGWRLLPRDTRSAAARASNEIRARVLDEAVHDDHLVKWLGGRELDASLISCATPFRLLAPRDPLVANTIAALEADLAHGGVHRYARDSYYGGGEWLLLAALLGWHYLEAGRAGDAYAQLRWVVEQARPNGDLPEQVSSHLLAPDHYEPWIERWGPVATPLLWSHAMFLTLAHELDLLGESAQR